MTTVIRIFLVNRLLNFLGWLLIFLSFATSTFFYIQAVREKPSLAKETKRNVLKKGTGGLSCGVVSIDDKIEAASLKLTRHVYQNYYGLAMGREMYEQDVRKCGGALFQDMAELAYKIDDKKDRDDFLAKHFEVYADMLECANMGAAHTYASLIDELRKKGGRHWIAARQNPMSIVVYGFLRLSDKAAWDWYSENASWCEPYVASLTISNSTELVKYLGIMKKHSKVLIKAKKELDAIPSDAFISGDEFTTDESDSITSYGAVLLLVHRYKETLEALANVGAPILESFNVVINSADAFDYSTAQGREFAGRALALYWTRRETSCIWEQAAAETGAGVVRLYQRVPHVAESVVRAYGSIYVASILLENFNRSERLLVNATEMVARYGNVGLKILDVYKNNMDVIKLLENDAIGWRMAPMMIYQGEAQALELLESDARFAKRFVNDDGTFKHEGKNLLEIVPGGAIYTVAKHWVKGEPNTMAELGWAAFDAVDVTVTILSLGGGKIASGGAKEAVKHAAKRPVKIAPNKRVLGILSKEVVRSGKAAATIAVGAPENAAIRTSCRKMSMRILLSAANGLRVSGRATLATGRKLFMTAKRLSRNRRLMFSAAVAMNGIILFERTLPELPNAVQKHAEDSGKATAGVIVGSIRGFLDGFRKGIHDVFGFEDDQDNFQEIHSVHDPILRSNGENPSPTSSRNRVKCIRLSMMFFVVGIVLLCFQIKRLLRFRKRMLETCVPGHCRDRYSDVDRGTHTKDDSDHIKTGIFLCLLSQMFSISASVCSEKIDIMPFEDMIAEIAKLDPDSREYKMWQVVAGLRNKVQYAQSGLEYDLRSRELRFVLESGKLSEAQKNELEDMCDRLAKKIEDNLIEQMEDCISRGQIEETNELITKYRKSEFLKRYRVCEVERICRNIKVQQIANAKQIIRLKRTFDENGVPIDAFKDMIRGVSNYQFYTAEEKSEMELAVKTIERLMAPKAFRLRFCKAARLSKPRPSYLKVALLGTSSEVFHVDFDGNVLNVQEPQWNFDKEIVWRCGDILSNPPGIWVAWKCRNGGFYHEYATLWLKGDIFTLLKLLSSPKLNPDKASHFEGGIPHVEIECEELQDPEKRISAVEKYLYPGTFWD